MATDKQIQANRRNARKSTGPRTEPGKARSSMNALRHGLTAEQSVLPHEDPHQYDELCAGFIASHNPQNPAELALVEELANAYWRLLRLRRVETRYWEHLGGCYNRGDDGIAEALLQSPDAQTRNFFRHYAQVERSYYRALAAVNDMHRQQKKAQPGEAATAASAANGFVSQNPQPSAENPQAAARPAARDTAPARSKPSPRAA